MITVSNLAMQYAGTVLFNQVDLQFTAGNCYVFCDTGHTYLTNCKPGNYPPNATDISRLALR